MNGVGITRERMHVMRSTMGRGSLVGGSMGRGTGLGREFEALEPYLKVARRHPPLTREQEYELATRARNGDPAARQALINHNLLFVVAVCRSWAGRGCRMDDLIQEGNLGLLKAVEHFDPELGNRFSTYAGWWIRAYVQKFARDMRATVKPVITGPGEAQFALPRDYSLDVPVGEDEEGATYLDLLEDSAPGPDDEFARNEQSEQINEALERVKKRIGGLGWDIIHERLKQEDPRTLEEIGRDWNLSRERVRQVEKTTRQFLQRYLEEFAA